MNKDKSILKYRQRLERRSFSAALDILRFYMQRRRLLKKLNSRDIGKIREKYKDRDDTQYLKYLDVEKWLPRNIWHVFILGLENSPPKNILDLGTGCGFFPFVCEDFGHTVKAVDLCDLDIFDDFVELLGVDRTCFRIEGHKPLPGFGKKFDLVTGFMVCFNDHKTNHVWGAAEWNFFLTDLAKNHLTPNAEAYFTLNEEPDGKLYDKSLYDFFIAQGAEIDGERVYFSNMKKFR